MIAYREVFGCQHFLCTWHVLSAWTKGVSQKMNKKGDPDRMLILDEMYKLMYISLPPTLSFDEAKKEVDAACQKFLDGLRERDGKKFHAVAKYFEYWVRSGKAGVKSHTLCMLDHVPGFHDPLEHCIQRNG